MLSTAAAIKLSNLECTLRYSCKTCISLVSLNGNGHKNLAGSSLPFPQKICCVGIPEDSERHSAFCCISTGIFKHYPRLFTKPICSTLCQSKRTRGLLWGGKAGYSYPFIVSSQYLPLGAVDYLATQGGFTLVSGFHPGCIQQPSGLTHCPLLTPHQPTLTVSQEWKWPMLGRVLAAKMYTCRPGRSCGGESSRRGWGQCCQRMVLLQVSLDLQKGPLRSEVVQQSVSCMFSSGCKCWGKQYKRGEEAWRLQHVIMQNARCGWMYVLSH